MQEKIQFSIVIPTYNRSEFLKIALESLINQTYQNWEAIVVDNYSADETIQVVKLIADSRIKFHQIQNNGIIAKSRNYGIQQAKGEWLGFLDSDDQYYPNKLKKCSAFITDNTDFIYHSIVLHHYSRNKQVGMIHAEKLSVPIFKSILFGGAPFATSSVLVRREVMQQVNGFNDQKKMIKSEDFHCWLLISRVTEKFLAIDEVLGMNLVGHSNESNPDMSRNLNAVYEYFYNELSVHERKVTSLITKSYYVQSLLREKEYSEFFKQLKILLFQYSIRSFVNYMSLFLFSRIRKRLFLLYRRMR